MLKVTPAPTTDFAYAAAGIPVIARITGVADRFNEAERAAEIIFSSSFATPYISRIAESGRALTAVAGDDGEPEAFKATTYCGAIDHICQTLRA